MSNDNGAMEQHLDRLAAAVEDLAAVVTTQGQQMATLVSATQQGFQTLTAQMLAHEGRMTSIEGRMASLEASMTEVLARLRIIGEAVATHTHEEQ